MASPTFTCTIRPTCSASFSTLHAWIDHELNDHFHNFDLHKCEYCMRAFYSENLLRIHWFGVHHSRTPALEYHAEDMLLGPHLGERYWCGFCGSVLCTVSPAGYARWVEEYYEHLEGHFRGTMLGRRFGHMASVGEWRYLPLPE